MIFGIHGSLRATLVGMAKKTETLDQYKKRIASAGGKARAAKLTKAERSQAAREAVNVRWAKLNKVKFDV